MDSTHQPEEHSSTLTQDPTQHTQAQNSLWPLDKVLQLQASDDIFQGAHLSTIKERILNDLQADILKATRHKYKIFTFLTFRDDEKGKNRQQLVEWIENIPYTTANEQLESNQVKALLSPSVSFMMSYQGYEYFCDEDRIRQLVPLEDDDITAFKNGLDKLYPDFFSCPEPRDTTKGFLDGTAHALLLIASNNDDIKGWIKDPYKNRKNIWDYIKKVSNAEKYLKNENELIEHKYWELGFRNPDMDDGPSKEWFGFRDGISNPRFFTPDAVKAKYGEAADEDAPLNVVLRKNRLAPKPYACGSFAVFMKLKQDEDAFDKYVKETAKNLGLSDYPGYVAAYIMGRHKNGTPLSKDEMAFVTKSGTNLNDFNYDDDAEGLKCPMSAHIRKANPRNGREYRIVRRGMLYDNGRKDEDKNEQGMLFFSYQGSLKTFEDLINKGIYRYSYEGKHTGIDVLFAPTEGYPTLHRYRDVEGRMTSPYTQKKEPMVAFKGGYYFFASAISFLKVNLRNCMKQID